MWLLSLGPAPTLMGNPFMYRGPYALLMYLPGFNSLRVPARFWMTVTLCLAVIGAMVFDAATGFGYCELAALRRGVRRPRGRMVGRCRSPAPEAVAAEECGGGGAHCRAAAGSLQSTSRPCTARCRTAGRSSTVTADIFRRTTRRFGSD